MTRLKLHTILLIWIAFLAACSPKSEVTKPVKLPSKSPKYLIKKVSETMQERQFDYLFTKFTVRSYINDDKLNFKGSMRIKSDSIIWISVTKLGGVEILRMVLTRDSVKFINKWDKEYFTGRLDELKEFGGIRMEYDFIQELLTAGPFGFDPADKYKSSHDNEYYILTSKIKSKLRKASRIIGEDTLLVIKTEEDKLEKAIGKKNEDELILKRYYLLPGSFLLAGQSVNLIAEQQAMEVNYTDYQMIDEVFPFPERVTIRVASKEKSSRFDIKFTSVKLNKPIEFPFRISKKYAPIEKKK